MFERKSDYTISLCAIFALVLLFIVSVVTTGVLVYYYAPCVDDNKVQPIADADALINDLSTISTQNKINIRLPEGIVPDSYELWIIPFLWEGNFTFHGEVKILINVTSDTNEVTLHAVDIKLDRNFTNIKEQSQSTTGTSDVKIADQRNDTDKQFYVIKTSSKLMKDKQYVVHLKFSGNLNDNMRGFYRSSYTVGNQTRWIAATQFEPTDARRAFPCFDEPALKAKFQINIARPKNMTSLSNMPVKQRKPVPVSGLKTYVWDYYERSFPMSTYLVAFIVSDFDERKSEDGKFRVWARHDAIGQAEYSLNIGPKILKYYENYFKIKYPLPKMDMVALPDFAMGAMENWGLMTFRETAMLYQKNMSTNADKQSIALTVSHELSHQWFGDLVTPSWWTDLWLNEGFASYMEYMGTNAVEPSWKVMEQFVIGLQTAFHLDAMDSTHPIYAEVDNPDEIDEIFDVISYQKGASIIRMMQHFLTTTVFKKGLSNYLNQKAYKNADQDDLWNALTKQAQMDKVLEPNVTVKDIMNTWTLQAGYPLVTVTRNYNNSIINVTQERLLLESNDTISDLKSLWWIPITYTSKKQLNFNNTRPIKWMKAERSISFNDTNVSPSEWVIFNVQETGYYRVNYDMANWKMIIKQLNEQNFKDIATINRAQLIDDSSNLAKAGKLNYTVAFDIMSYLVHEVEFLPWSVALEALEFFNKILIKTQSYDKFRLLTLKLLDNIYKQVGFIDNVTDPHLKVLTRVEILVWACYFEHEDCVMNAVQQFKQWQNTSNPDIHNPISPNLRSIVYCTAIRMGGQSEWEFAWQRYLNANVGSEKNVILETLTCTREIWLLNRMLNWAFTENSGIRKQDAVYVFEMIAAVNPAGQSLSFNYLRNNWDRLKNYFGPWQSNINNLIKSVSLSISTKYELIDVSLKNIYRKSPSFIVQSIYD
ncbi:hypothetical protein PUN28_000801 [Cardiocondyla obscurior]|uniref:Aminopeptidase n=1 Tax=Cardiocondyla obscurior TaxID=286306 RepID=A0AAW2H1G8_9HYME